MITLDVKHVSYSYRTKYQTVNAVKDVTCTMESGSLYALVGKSGSGKTTLLSLLAGLEQPDSGSILVNGVDLRNMNIDIYRREHASVIYQNFNLFPFLTVLENVMYPLILNGQSKLHAEERARKMLNRVGLDTNYLKRLPAMLSGGEQQRVAVARALANSADLILADEPTGNLDSENTKLIVDLLKKLARDNNCCVVVVTHDESVAEAADCVYRMDSGRLKEDMK